MGRTLARPAPAPLAGGCDGAALQRALHLVAARIVEETVVRGVAREVVGPTHEIHARRAHGGNETHAGHGVAQETAPQLRLLHEPAQRPLGAESVHLAVHPEL